ncbi:ketopantoate reductase family protein [Microlunatus capsulatus]|uniref:2-dehydropantoate 2-reductase n=1 Tax=Microlunatus capsulatus TaxID=99117 RepID=A0ABS4ZAT2_9ACTN|nr:2-dehydropantoate 2-reductase N-terminal domain-containing protein [Microlunatus capsulatus]MBP2417830.1 2-dehydropantoate 2-reductase [Microlunatus capsulatus]
MSTTRYVIVGAGAIGGAIGGRLAHAGLDAVLVARGEHLAALRSTGLRLRTPEEDVTVPVHAVGGPDELELTEHDVLVVATKTQQAPDALTTWADAPVHAGGRVVGTAGERLPVLTALNGVASETMALRYFARVYGVCVWMPAVHLTPGEVIVRGAPRSGMLHVGRVPAPADERDEALLAQVQQDWTAANYDVPLPEDVMPWKYRKLISNLGNVFQALVHGNGDTGPLAERTEAEARTVLDGAGIAVTSDEDEAAARSAGFTMHPVPGVPDDVGGSTWQSLTRGTGNVETDYLNGEIALIAHRTGQAAPLNARLATLARQAAASGMRPGAMSADELAERLGLA